MKNVKFILVLAFVYCATLLQAQEFKLKVSGSKTLKLLELNNTEIEGYDGNEVIISTEIKKKKDEERAKGLTAISGIGLTDNTGIGLSILEKGNDVEVQQIAKRTSNKYIIKVPKSVKISYIHSGVEGKTFKIKNVSAEIEASVKHNGIRLEDVTGPMTINSVHGKIEAIFSSVSQSNPISIISVHGLVDVSLPSNTKANLKMEAKYGELLTNMDIEFNKTDDELRSFSSKVNGKLNGGGVEIYLVSNHGNVYLRNK